MKVNLHEDWGRLAYQESANEGEDGEDKDGGSWEAWKSLLGLEILGELELDDGKVEKD